MRRLWSGRTSLSSSSRRARSRLERGLECFDGDGAFPDGEALEDRRRQPVHAVHGQLAVMTDDRGVLPRWLQHVAGPALEPEGALLRRLPPVEDDLARRFVLEDLTGRRPLGRVVE